MTLKSGKLLLGGFCAGLLLIAGEATLNLTLLAADWQEVFTRFSLPEPTGAVVAQGIVKLLVLGIMTCLTGWLIAPRFATPTYAGITAGLIIWALIWAWVQWGMLLAGFVTPRIALLTTLWGLPELVLAGWLGTIITLRPSRRF
jgi:hypothetical protein